MDLSEESDATLRLINQMLMEEEDLANKPCMFTDILALHATERSFYNALVSSNQDSKPPGWVPDETNIHDYVLQTVLRTFSSANTISPPVVRNFTGGSSRRRSRELDDSENFRRSNKQLASFPDETDDEPQEAYDKVLLCPILNPHLQQNCDQWCPNRSDNSSNRSKARVKKKIGNKQEIIDLNTLLLNCAQASATFDLHNAYDILRQIRQHSSPQGDGTQRLAHYFANAIEARLAGNGTTAHSAFNSKRRPAADILRGHQLYVTASPFNKVSNSYANKSIMKLAANSNSLHIIDFGILYGFQWPCLIQNLSVRPGGPPKIRITGIDFPQPGFRPAERIEETGRRLGTYCKRFNVPFQFTPIAKKWDSINLEDLHIKPDELLVVNSMNRLRHMLDETIVMNSPRDAVLKLIKQINPDLFIHGEMTGTYGAPFFVTRFREAVFHFSSMFDMLDTILQGGEKGQEERLVFEKEIMGRDIMNVVACEGLERIERPETYKQWQMRLERAGFRQQGLNKEIMEETVENIKKNYHKEFTVDRDGEWMLQGWKGRIVYCISSWKPNLQ
ncbi:scarecrow-like protein 14 [Impatiens glandulifera]|uniref:scarecrow-like protein 14 n=1 Tax=Impatiens glandulifera TaxID=253017 RepID=UPI001FB1315B|nr:scarecrow-like protein 14 [Impatiens glandulifera]